jgi:2-keto-4-pentenoate hydratase/2-oxohepta-3-ene-1,7-dioic acid hydratase in catechol pathway
VDAAAGSADAVPVDSLQLVSPITTPCRLVAQATNFASHVKDVGRDPAKTPLTFFRKASGSVTGPFGDIIKPEHVKLLDYEVEIGRELSVGTEVTEANLADFVVGLVLTNDVSARDVQISKQQFFESKSYPTFTPVGPALVLLTADELQRFGELRLRLSVNGEVRQNMVVDGDILFPPVQALQTLSKFQKLQAGDIVLTGTPVGTALTLHGQAPKGEVDLGAFLTAQYEKNPAYLKDGDVVEASIATDDGAIDLGVQRTTVRWTP